MGKPHALPKCLADGIQTVNEGTIHQRDAFGFFPSVFCMVSLPVRSQPGKTEYTRRYQAAEGLAGFTMMTRSEYGLPYGGYLRHIMLYLATTAKKQHGWAQDGRFKGDPSEIFLGNDLTQAIVNMTGKHPSTLGSGGVRGTRTIFDRQLASFIRTALFIYAPDNGFMRERCYTVSLDIEEETPTLFPMGSKPPEWRKRLRMSPGFFEDCVQHAPPVDQDKIRACWPSTLRHDILVWASYKANRKDGHLPFTLSRRNILQQFGSDYDPKSARAFHAGFCRELKFVQQIFDVNDRDCINVREDGDKMTFTIKHPSVLRFPGAEPQLFLQPEASLLPTLAELTQSNKRLGGGVKGMYQWPDKSWRSTPSPSAQDGLFDIAAASADIPEEV